MQSPLNCCDIGIGIAKSLALERKFTEGFHWRHLSIVHLLSSCSILISLEIKHFYRSLCNNFEFAVIFLRFKFRLKRFLSRDSYLWIFNSQDCYWMLSRDSYPVVLKLLQALTNSFNQLIFVRFFLLRHKILSSWKAHHPAFDQHRPCARIIFCLKYQEIM